MNINTLVITSSYCFNLSPCAGTFGFNNTSLERQTDRRTEKHSLLPICHLTQSTLVHCVVTLPSFHSDSYQHNKLPSLNYSTLLHNLLCKSGRKGDIKPCACEIMGISETQRFSRCFCNKLVEQSSGLRTQMLQATCLKPKVIISTFH